MMMFSFRSASLILAALVVSVAGIGNSNAAMIAAPQQEDESEAGRGLRRRNETAAVDGVEPPPPPMVLKNMNKISDSDSQELLELTKKNFASEWVDEDDEGEGRDLQVVSGSWRAMVVGGFDENGYAVGVASDTKVYPYLRHSANIPSMQWYFIPVSGSSYGVIYNGYKVNGARRCLDYNFNGNYLYAHACHSGSNQRWKPYSQGELQTLHGEGRCLDFDFNKVRMYMHACHTGWNQNFVWAKPPAAYALT